MKPSSNCKLVYFRADGDNQIGLGHLIRCQSLAEMIKNDYQVKFCSRIISDELFTLFRTNNIDITRIENESSFIKMLNEEDGVVLDGYSFNLDYQQEIKERGSKLAVIDDIHSEPICADLIINPAPGVNRRQYHIADTCNASPKFALGPNYALLRPAFFQANTSILSLPEPDKTLLICFGGSDVKNLTRHALDIAIHFKQFNKITIITGSAYRHQKDLVAEFKDIPHLQFLHAINDVEMARNLAEADLAVIPASGILFETLAMNTVAVSGMYVDNQKDIYLGFKKLNAFVDAGTFEKEMLRNALEKASSFTPKTIVDKKSPGRYRALFKKIMN